MTRNPLLADIAIAVALTILVLIILPGLAVVALIAVAVLLVCAISFAIGAVRRRRTRALPPRRGGRPPGQSARSAPVMTPSSMGPARSSRRPTAER